MSIVNSAYAASLTHSNSVLRDLENQALVPMASEKLTGDERDIGKFKPASLRNVAITGPYMFDGSLPTLDAVIDPYARGGAILGPTKLGAQRPTSLSCVQAATRFQDIARARECCASNESAVAMRRATLCRIVNHRADN